MKANHLLHKINVAAEHNTCNISYTVQCTGTCRDCIVTVYIIPYNTIHYGSLQRKAFELVTSLCEGIEYRSAKQLASLGFVSHFISLYYGFEVMYHLRSESLEEYSSVLHSAPYCQVGEGHPAR